MIKAIFITALATFAAVMLGVLVGYFMGKSGRKIKFIEGLPLGKDKEVFEDLGPVDVTQNCPYGEAMEEP